MAAWRYKEKFVLSFSTVCTSVKHRTRVKVHCTHYSTQKVSTKQCHSRKTEKVARKQHRWNAFNVQMLSSSLHQQIFKEKIKEEDETELMEKINKSKKHLEKHNLHGKTVKRIPDVNFQLPRLYGKNIDDHFKVLAMSQSNDHRKLAKFLAENPLPPMPKEWSYSSGWTAYLADGTMKAVDFPDDKTLIFDIESCVMEGNYPTLAVAASPTTWYSWCSDRLIEGRLAVAQRTTLQDLIPLESPLLRKPIKKDLIPRLVVGHNISYDRSFVKEQYFIQSTRLRFLDTLSLHMCVSGLTTYQRSLWMESDNKGSVTTKKKSNGRRFENPSTSWQKESSPNNLVDVYNCYINGGRELDKSKRDTFISGTMDDIRMEFQDLMTYCAQDVGVTHEVFQVLLNKFFERFPHPVTFSAMLEMGQCYLPVNQNWERYLQEAQETYENLQNEMKILLMQLADENCQYLHNNLYKDDPWLWDLDWSVENFRLKKSYYDKLDRSASAEEMGEEETEDTKEKRAKTKEISKEETVGEDKQEMEEDEVETDEEKRLERVKEKLSATLAYLPKRSQHMVGYPRWYRELCPRQNNSDFIPGPSNISSQTRVTPKLMRMTWEGYPLHFTSKHGWGYLVPKDEREPEETSEGITKESDPNREIELEKSETTGSGSEDQPTFPIRALRALLEARRSRQRESKVETQQDTEAESTGYTQYGPVRQGRHPCVDVDVGGCWFYKLPHKDGGGANVGNPLAKDFLNKLEDGTLSSEGGTEAEKILEINKLISFWRNANNRILSQMVVHFSKSDLPKNIVHDPNFDDEGMYGAILPRVITAGTVTRRAVEPTWLTASNALPNRVGSELKAMVQAPPGYHFVGSDVDSQELWIAAILGDSNFVGIHGGTAFGWMTLQGNKKDGTDMHSMTANTVGISRDHAKVINYARIYGAGTRFARHLLMQFNHNLSKEEAWEKAKDIFATTKGELRYHLTPAGQELFKLLKIRSKEPDEDDDWATAKELSQIPLMLRKFAGSLEGVSSDAQTIVTKLRGSRKRGSDHLLEILTDKQAWFNGS
ncbi:DNA polymerase subunit gamma-1 [Holothuria leucospilota]|uniref:DNA polymerase subunit gamma-1 n=1 Tax=Holothuria leucospilota TaxID=206669 RepID=A0A9Q1BM71_HOLLE|nr:DNA polymerase subunit gamma-1 [Holothuria leucospilota]